MTQQEIHGLLASLPGLATLVETHISWVILTAQFAYKVKKPLRLSFLDFSTKEARQRDCHNELLLNRRLAPDVYLDIVPVCEHLGKISFGHSPGGTIIDHALRMRRLDMDLEMDRRLEAGAIDMDYMGTLAHKVAAFHRQQPPLHLTGRSDATTYRTDFNDILEQLPVFTELLGTPASNQILAAVQASDHFLTSHEVLIHQRMQQGFVRDLHGDLHTRNIFAYPDPVIFDCIEFNEHFRQIDVLSEIAFLCMDLEERGFETHSQAFLAAYLDRFPAMGTPAERQLFIWFKCYRANVRAKVAAITASQGSTLTKCIEEMAQYLQAMLAYARQL